MSSRRRPFVAPDFWLTRIYRFITLMGLAGILRCVYTLLGSPGSIFVGGLAVCLSRCLQKIHFNAVVILLLGVTTGSLCATLGEIKPIDRQLPTSYPRFQATNEGLVPGQLVVRGVVILKTPNLRNKVAIEMD